MITLKEIYQYKLNSLSHPEQEFIDTLNRLDSDLYAINNYDRSILLCNDKVGVVDDCFELIFGPNIAGITHLVYDILPLQNGYKILKI